MYILLICSLFYHGVVSPFEDLVSRHQHKEIAGACQSSRWTATLTRRTGSEKVCIVFQITSSTFNGVYEHNLEICTTK